MYGEQECVIERRQEKGLKEITRNYALPLQRREIAVEKPLRNRIWETRPGH